MFLINSNKSRLLQYKSLLKFSDWLPWNGLSTNHKECASNKNHPLLRPQVHHLNKH